MNALLTTDEMAEADRLTIASGTPGFTLMERAGRAVADVVARFAPIGAQVVVMAGPGNNGGDGFIAAQRLLDRGYRVRVLLHGDRGRLKGDAALAAERWTGSVEPASPDLLLPGRIIVDALFGAGLDRPVEGVARAIIEAMNGAGVPIIAVDVPSGVSGSTGEVFGVAVQAKETVTFFRRKPGHLLLPGRLHCGMVRVADIGIPDSVLEIIKPQSAVNTPEAWFGLFPMPRIGGHKYNRGHAVVVSGGIARTGASRLAARGALRAGAGLVTIACPPDALAVQAAANLAVMVRKIEGAGGLSEMLSDARFNAIVLGPGGGVGAPMRDMVRVALDGERGVVLDADALTSFADEPDTLFKAIAARPGRAVVLTPHEGEFRKLFGVVAGSKLDRARAAAQRSGAIVLLKGADSVVAAPDGRATLSENAPPWLASAGSGDVLAGMIAGLLAQEMPVFEAVNAAVWLHGEAGIEAGPGLIAEDLPEMLPRIYRRRFTEWASRE